MIKPLYLLADSQLLFWKGEGGLPERIRQDLSSGAKAAYIGASNQDQPEFYHLFVAAMESMGITNCRMVPAQLKDDDKAFIEQAELLLLAGGNVELGWRVFESNGLKNLIPKKRYDGCTLIGISAGAVQLGVGTLSEDPQPKKIELFRFAPFYVGAHDEGNDWWDLRALVNLSQSDVRGVGIPTGGGAIYWPDGALEPLRRPLTEFMKEGDQVIEHMIVPATTATDI